MENNKTNEPDELSELIKKEMNNILNTSNNTAHPTSKPENPTHDDDMEDMLPSTSTDVQPIRHHESSVNLEENIEKIKCRLEQSYNFFNNLGEKLNAIDFTNLRNHIREYQLINGNTDMGKTNSAELKQKFDESFMENRLPQLTAEMRAGFHKHPGEFGDIPELSEYFKTCNQLHRGLTELEQTHRESIEVQNLLMSTTESNLNRVKEIKEILKKDNEDKATKGEEE